MQKNKKENHDKMLAFPPKRVSLQEIKRAFFVYPKTGDQKHFAHFQIVTHLPDN